MKKITVLFFLFYKLVFALELSIESDNLKDVTTILSKEQNIQKLLQEKRVAFESLAESFSEQSRSSGQYKGVQREYKIVKMLSAYVSPATTKEQLKSRLQQAFFKQYASKVEEYSFAYKVEYNTATTSGDKAVAKLQSKIAQYILENFAVSNIENSTKVHNFTMEFLTKNTTVGVIEANGKKSFENPYGYGAETTTRSGVMSFYFYPFAVIQRDVAKLAKTKENAMQQEKFFLLKDAASLQNPPYPLSSLEEKRIQEFVQTNTNATINKSAIVNAIAKKVNSYNTMAQNIFKHYQGSRTLAELEFYLEKKLQATKTIHSKKQYRYCIDLYNDDDLEYVVLPAFRKFEKKLKQDTQFKSYKATQSISNSGYEDETTQSTLVAVVKTVSLQTYYKNDNTLGICFVANVSFEESDVCKAHLVGKAQQKLFTLEFVQLKGKEGVVEFATKQLENRLFAHLYKHPRYEKGCKRTTLPNQPVNCLSYETLDDFIVQLNSHSKVYRYRYPTCEEMQYFATCGGKQKYCWGNKKEDSSLFEHIATSKYDNRLYATATKKQNQLGLFDFCGNGVEYCIDKRNRYKTFGSIYRKYEPSLQHRSYADVGTIRLVRQKR